MSTVCDDVLCRSRRQQQASVQMGSSAWGYSADDAEELEYLLLMTIGTNDSAVADHYPSVPSWHGWPNSGADGMAGYRSFGDLLEARVRRLIEKGRTQLVCDLLFRHINSTTGPLPSNIWSIVFPVTFALFAVGYKATARFLMLTLRDRCIGEWNLRMYYKLVEFSFQVGVSELMQLDAFISSWPRERHNRQQYNMDNAETDVAASDVVNMLPDEVFNMRICDEGRAGNMTLTSEHCQREVANVPQWLKTLRLHKYTALFSCLSYHQIMNLTYSALRMQHVTQGASRKILLSIEALRRRASILKKMEMQGFIHDNSMKTALLELKSIANTPLCPYEEIEPNSDHAKRDGFGLLPDEVDDRNVPAHLTRVIGKACTQLKACSTVEVECVQIFCDILQGCLKSKAFTRAQTTRLREWLEEANRFGRTMNGRRKGKQRAYSVPFGNVH